MKILSFQFHVMSSLSLGLLVLLGNSCSFAQRLPALRMASGATSAAIWATPGFLLSNRLTDLISSNSSRPGSGVATISAQIWIISPDPRRFMSTVFCTVATPRRQVIAMDPATGETLWTFREPETIRHQRAPRQAYGKGVSYAELNGRGVIFITTPGFFSGL